jgi:glycosyltransferase involved in cell wall biosynthesis
MPKPINVVFISTYPPRQCGIANFTHDLANAIAVEQKRAIDLSNGIKTIAINNIPEGYQYTPEVSFEIREQYKADYRRAAEFLNISNFDVVCLQHEYGIFGGEGGNYILELLSDLKKPIVTTFHTVLQKPNSSRLKTLKTIASLSTFVVAISEKAAKMLHEIYRIPRGKIVFIHHGTPDVPFLDSSYYKDQFHLEGRRVILTFGLISPSKGIEYAISAMEKVVKLFPDVVYIILGATHPVLKRKYGEKYRLYLEQLVRKKKLERHVIFYNEFVPLEQLTRFLITADIYLTPYLSKEQISSGTLAYAVACGKAIISTPYWHAEEMLKEKRGILVPFRDSNAISKALIDLLRNETERNRMRKTAYQFGRQMVWRAVANVYIQTFTHAIEGFSSRSKRSAIRGKIILQPSLPEVSLDHIKLLTDDTGILQYASYTVPSRVHGYSTDENACALMMTAINWLLFKDETIIPLLYKYLSFLQYAFDSKSGKFRGHINYNRVWDEGIGSEDCHSKAIWALGNVINSDLDEEIISMATELFDSAWTAVGNFESSVACAYSILGGLSYLKRFGGATNVKTFTLKLGDQLKEKFKKNITKAWSWCDDVIAYDNARLPQALISAGKVFHDEKMVQLGVRVLKWLSKIQTHPDGHFSMIGTDGWFVRGGKKARFNQQPSDVSAFIDACEAAYNATKDKSWIDKANHAFHWFLGDNDLSVPLYDFKTKGCGDVLQTSSVSRNQGAEATLSWLLSLQRMYLITRDTAVPPKKKKIVTSNQK